MPMSDYERNLVSAVKNGDEKSFEELYKIYYKKVYFLAKTTLKNNTDAEDVLQQTFILTWKNISSLEDNDAFNTWIQKITLNQCHSLMRKNKPEVSIDDENDKQEILELESDLMLPEVYAQKEDLKIRLGKIIDGLSEVQRQSIQLYYFDEMSVDEIASVMNCSVGTVKSRLFLARNAIRTEIEEAERKTGTKFYGIIGVPVLAFSKVFSDQIAATSISPASGSSIFEKISAALFDEIKKIAIESTNNIAKEVTGNEIKSSFQKATNATVKGATKFASKPVSSIIKLAGKKIAASLIALGVLGGSIAGTITNAGSSVVLPNNADGNESYFAEEANIPEIGDPENSGHDTESKDSSLESESSPKYESWKTAYESFIFDKKFLNEGDKDRGYGDLESGFAVISFGLHDMNSDDTPELIIFNGFNGRDLRSNYIFTFSDEKVVYCGNTSADVYVVKDYPGMFSGVTQTGWYLDDEYSGKYAEVTILNYLSLENNTVVKDRVSVTGLPIASSNRVSIYQTSNTKLLEESRKDHSSYRTMTWTELQNVGWDNFVALYCGSDNRIQTQKIKFNDNFSVDLNWGWELFNKDSSEYDHNLAMAGLILSQAAELGKAEIEQRYKALGFNNIRAVYYDTKKDYMDMPAACFASSIIKFGDNNKYIVSITVRGTDLDDRGDIQTDLGSVIYGFNTAANNVRTEFRAYYESLSNLYGETVNTDNSIVFITGHSLGGAIAGQLGQMLEGVCGHRNSIFDYTFASPNYQTFNYDKASYTNIHNIINIQDVVPTVPWGYGKYGHCWYYDSCEDGMNQYLTSVYTEEEWNDIQNALHDNTLIFVGAMNRGITGITANHICQTYLACMLKDIPSNIGEGAESQYSLSSIHCPVDIKIYDNDGNIAAWTSGDKVFYSKGANLIVTNDNGEKSVYVPGGIEYNIMFVGTDNGTMDYSQQVIRGDQIISEKAFTNVEIKTDKLLYSTVDSNDISSQDLLVVDSKGNVERNVFSDGQENKVLFDFSWLGWLFIALDVISAAVFLISILSIAKAFRKKKSAVLDIK